MMTLNMHMLQTNKNNIIPYKERTIDTTLPVRVFRNLNKKGVWYSIRQKGLTVAHASVLCLEDARFIVNQKTRERIVKTKRKEVHAYVEGHIVSIGLPNPVAPAIIKYNPFKYENFTCTNGNWFDVDTAKYVIFDKSGLRATHLNLIHGKNT